MKLRSFPKANGQTRAAGIPAVAIFPVLLLAACSTQPRTTLQLGNKTLNVATAALAGGNPRMALRVADAVLESAPDDPRALIDRGDAYYLMNDCARSETDYRHALREKPHAADAEIGLGRCALARNPRTAIADFSRAAGDDPSSATAANDLGVAYAESGKFTAAEAEFEKTLALSPDMKAASVNLGMSLALGGKPDRAETILGPLARGPGATARIRADDATALVLANRKAAARRILLADMPDTEAQGMTAQLARLAPLEASPDQR